LSYGRKVILLLLLLNSLETEQERNYTKQYTQKQTSYRSPIGLPRYKYN